MNKKEKEAFIALAKSLHKDHGCIGSESFETCTAEICVMARSVSGLTQRAADAPCAHEHLFSNLNLSSRVVCLDCGETVRR